MSIIELDRVQEEVACHPALPEVEKVVEPLNVAFTVPWMGPEGHYVRQQHPEIHFAMLDTGAMVNCMSHAVIAAFPVLRAYYVEAQDVLRGVGSVRCQVLGELRKVPVSLGGDQAAGSIVLCNFRVIEGSDY